MESVIRGALVYFFLLFVFRIAGKRTLSQATTFDFVLLLIISETTQQAMVDHDHSITNGMLLILTLVGIDVGLSLLKQRFGTLNKLLDGMPLLVIENGEMHLDRMRNLRVDEEDILMAARLAHGLDELRQIKHAVVEPSGEISIIPYPGDRRERSRS